MRLPAARLPTTKRAAGAARHDDTVERAFELAAADPARLDDLLGALRLGWLWVPLPDDGAAGDRRVRRAAAHGPLPR